MAIDEPRATTAPQKVVAPPTSSPTEQPVKASPSNIPSDESDHSVKPARVSVPHKENGHPIASSQPHSQQPAGRYISNHDMNETPEAGASPPERDLSPADPNGHAVPTRAQHHAQQQNIMGLAAAFDGLSVAGPPGHPQLVHAHHHMQMPHPLAHRPHPGQLAVPPHQQPQHPHPHAHLHPPHVTPGGQHPQPPPHLMPHGHPTTLQMWVPQDRVGAVIGSQGAVIKALQDRSRATIQVHNDTVRGDRKLFTIVGGPTECTLARQLVTEIIERPRSGHGPPSAGSQSPNHHGGEQRANRSSYSHYQDQADRPGQLSKTVYVPTSCVGLVIGRRGETIRHLQGKSGATIFVTRDRDAGQGAAERSVLISGTESAIRTADMLVSQIVREACARKNATGQPHPGSSGAQGGAMVEILTVPDDKVGLIIGKGGAAIRELQSLSGAKIQVAKEDEGSSNSNTRPVTITGVRHCIEMAKQLIAEKVNMHLPPSSNMQNFSPQQASPYPPPNPQMYYPVYEPGFGHPMQGPYQHGPPQQAYDPADPQAQMRAALAYYQYYGSAAAAVAHHHQQMQYQNQEQHRQQHPGHGMPPRPLGEGPENADQAHPSQEGSADAQLHQGSSVDSTGEASQGQSIPESETPPPHSKQQQDLLVHHPHSGGGQRNSFGMQDHRVHAQSVSTTGQSQPMPHIARQHMHAQQQQQMQHVSHQLQHGPPRGRMIPNQPGHVHPQVAHQARVVAHMQAQAVLHAQAHAHAHARHFQVAQAQAQAQQVQTQTQGQTQSGGQEMSPPNNGSAGNSQVELTQGGGNTTGDEAPQK